MKQTLIKSVWIIGVLVSLITACTKENNPEGLASLSTDAPIEVNDSTYTLGGNVSNQGSSVNFSFTPSTIHPKEKTHVSQRFVMAAQVCSS